MKKSFFLILTFVTLFLIQGQAQTLDEIINNHIEALGGIGKLRALKSMTTETKMIRAGSNIEMKSYFIHGKAYRIEYTEAGKSGYTILTDKGSWIFLPSMGHIDVTERTEEELKEAVMQIDIQGPLVDYKAKGSSVEYLGKETIQGLEYFKLYLTRANGKIETYYLDKNYLIAKKVYAVSIQGNQQLATTEYYDYRKTPEGYMMSYKVIDYGVETIFNKVEINPKIDESIFKPSN